MNEQNPEIQGGPLINRVMLVDDEKFDIEMYRRIITRSGMISEIVAFTSAQEALAYLLDPDSLPVEMIFLDINMPRMTGFEFMEAACATLGPDFHVPVIMMLTTSMSPDDRARAATFSPIKAFFNKPITNDHLSTAASIVKGAA